MTDKNARGGWHSATCPKCGGRFSWPTAKDVTHIVACNNTDPDTGKDCNKKMTRGDWEYLRFMERRREERRAANR